jgi:hypothetical protein
MGVIKRADLTRDSAGGNNVPYRTGTQLVQNLGGVPIAFRENSGVRGRKHHIVGISRMREPQSMAGFMDCNREKRGIRERESGIGPE